MIKDLAPPILILLMFAVGVFMYPEMPDNVAVHWNARGNADGFSSKLMGLVLIPAITVGLYILFLIIPKIAVFKKNIQSFIEYYQNIIIVFTAFMAALYFATILWNMGYRYDMGVFMVPAVAILIYYLGHIMKHMKRNFFVGIRTPWTLANDSVWKRTHEIGSVTFRVTAVIMLVGVLAPKHMIWFILIPVLGNALFLVVYSYILYQKEKKNEL